MSQFVIVGDGTLDFPEFLTMMSGKLESSEQERELQRAFQEFDRDGNGYISREELKEVMHSVGDKLTDDELDGMIKRADLDNDGQVDYRGREISVVVMLNAVVIPTQLK